MEFSGIVTEGSQKAGALGYPTVNLPCPGLTLSGIYAGLVRIDRQEHPAVVYADQRRKLLEAHLLNFKENLYGETVGLRLLDKLRDDREFKDAKEQEEAIVADVESAKAYFKH